MNTPKITLIDRIKCLPPYIGNEIFRFIIPNACDIQFYTSIKQRYSDYSIKYQTGYINGERVKNVKNQYLSRICKKNGKHRYYMTNEFIDTIEVEHHDREFRKYYYQYRSNYVGKNINYALLIIFGS